LGRYHIGSERSRSHWSTHIGFNTDCRIGSRAEFFGAGADSLMENFSNAERVEYVSAWMRFCNSDGCLTRAGPSAEDLVVWDQAHLSEKGSEYLGEAIANYLLAADTANIFNAAP
jgi:hypothetical protein